MAQDVRIAVVGTGYIAQTVVAAMRLVPGLSVLGICSHDPARARDVARLLRLPKAYESLDHALADASVDALYVANKTANHAAVTIRALEAGKAVLCEKPFATDLAEAERVIAAARRSGKLFMEALATPFLPAIQATFDETISGRLGEPRHVSASFGYPATEATHPGCYETIGGGVLLDRGVYLIALALKLLGPVVTIEAYVVRNAAGIDLEASLLLTHARDGVSQLAASLTSCLSNSMSLSLTRGLITVPAPLLAAERVVIDHADAPERPQVAGAMRQRIKGMPAVRRAAQVIRRNRGRFLPFDSSIYLPELLHFRDLFRVGAIESPILPPSISIDVARIIEAAQGADT